MTNEKRVQAFVIQAFRHFLLCPSGEQKRERDADGCAKIAHQFDGRNQQLM
jgi:hypothetical protein